MKQSRLETLYKRPLASPDKLAKIFPWQHLLTKNVVTYPQKPQNIAILEIGPGRGDFLFHLATTYPTQNILGIEMGKNRFQKLVKNIQKKNLKNVFLIHGDARLLFLDDFKEMSLEKIFVLFPDPWPRNRHRHKRLLQKNFLEVLCKKLKPGGVFTLATDVADYASWVMKNLESLGAPEKPLRGSGSCLDIPCSPKGEPGYIKPPALSFLSERNFSEAPFKDAIPTFFAEKWQKMGRTCHYVRVKKI